MTELEDVSAAIRRNKILVDEAIAAVDWPLRWWLRLTVWRMRAYDRLWHWAHGKWKAPWD